MDNTVVIKGTKSGIILVLDSDTEYDKLKEAVASKFKESAAFLGKAQKAVAFQGRELTEEQKLEMIDIIHQNCQLSIVCIMEQDERLEHSFRQTLEKNLINQDYNTGQFFKGNLRTGKVIDVETSNIIIVHLKPAAKEISKGNVIILGSLKGNVYAGSSGNQNAFVVALDMDPMQIRIADTIARSPDKPKKKGVQITKIAFWEDGNIYIEPLDIDVMGDFRL